jgi:hypothetical protein
LELIAFYLAKITHFVSIHFENGTFGRKS